MNDQELAGVLEEGVETAHDHDIEVQESAVPRRPCRFCSKPVSFFQRPRPVPARAPG